eukprot:TRINITY_DN100425_c0_g1_i1.p1 TRINITY_DN100425_c0_g1~~TRINITY_DN100425_c0_g1_i1.p1  ORF type:complete len:354 (+),score=54.32 TRINITY_DN100425_c0_g1_i1:108-1169(+)
MPRRGANRGSPCRCDVPCVAVTAAIGLFALWQFRAYSSVSLADSEVGEASPASTAVAVSAAVPENAYATTTLQPRPVRGVEGDAAAAEEEEFVRGCVARLVLATVDTRSPEDFIDAYGHGGWKFVNIGKGKPWAGRSTKIKYYDMWLQEQPDTTSIVMLSDIDVVAGGCSKDEVCRRYHRVVAASGGPKVIFSAEMGLYPRTTPAVKHNYSMLFGRLTSSLGKLGLPENIYGAKAHCRLTKVGPCSDPPVYQFLNSGFVIGPVAELRQAIASIRRIPTGRGNHDQWSATAYYFYRPDMVALDYAGLVAMSLHNLNLSQVLRFEEERTVNLALGHTQCFMHFNGIALKGLVKEH